MKIGPFKLSYQPTLATVAKVNQETLPSNQLSIAESKITLGDSGTRGLHGIINEEYLGILQGRTGVMTFDEMRRNDSTVSAVCLAVTLPIRRAEWFIKSGSTDANDEEIKDFVQHALFDWIEGDYIPTTWDDILRQALLMMPLGCMVFEKVYGMKEFEGKTYVILKKFAPRLPKSIQQWELADGTFGIQQIRQDGGLAQISGEKLAIFVNNLEGTNWWGSSMLRPAYKNWFYKKFFYNIDSVSFERQGMGIPYIKMPKGYSPAQERKASKALSNLRASESAYLVIPDDYEIGFMDMKGHTTRDPESSIAHHNREIVKAALAQFLDLGSQKVGSHALSEDQSSLFLKSLEAVANVVCSVFNRQVIRQLVDLNFDNVTNYPILDYAKIEQQDVEKLANAYNTLVTANGINPTGSDEDYLRSLLGLPDYDEEDAKDFVNEEELGDHQDVDPQDSQDDQITQNVDPNEQIDQLDGKLTKPQDDQTTPAAKLALKKKQDLKKKMSEGKFKSWRTLTFAEQKVDFQKIQDFLDKLEAGLTSEAKSKISDSQDLFMAQIIKALQDEDMVALKKVETDFEKQYKDILKIYMLQGYDFGKTGAAKEIGISTPTSNPDILKNLDLLADAVASKLASDMESKAKITISSLKARGFSLAQVAGNTDVALDNLVDTSVDNTAATVITGAMNIGRNDVFERNPEDIYALQRSEILDKKTCNFCISMDGRIIEKDDDLANTTQFHSDCRGIWVAILNDEVDKPSIDGVPQSIRDRFGGNVNELMQLKKPIVKKGSRADNFLNKQEAAKAKVASK